MKHILLRIKNEGISIRFIHIFTVISLVLLCAALFYSHIKLQSEYAAITGLDASGEQSIAFYMKLQRTVIILIVLVLLVSAGLLYTKVLTVIKLHTGETVCSDAPSGGDVSELRYPAAAYDNRDGKYNAKERHPDTKEDHDAQADVMNRGEFEKTVSKILDREEETGWLMLIDVDKLQKINDSYGCETGDALLRDIALTLKLNFRSYDYVGRLESDEFAVWLAGLSEDNTDYLRKRISAVNDRLMHPKNGIPPVSLSAGAAFSGAKDDFKSLYKKANGALYRVKVGGRCGFEIQQS